MQKLPVLALLAATAAVLMAGCTIGQATGATDVTHTSATLNGNVAKIDTGLIEYWFRYGQATDYGTETQHHRLTVTDPDNHHVSEPIGGLSPGTTYHFQLCAVPNGHGKPYCGGDETFSTKSELDLCGHITRDQTLSPDQAIDYVVTCPVTVDPGVTLTLAAGTVVKSQEAAVSVEGGSLVADGTVGAPVVFTSIYDGSVGGATSESFDPQPGAWGGLEVRDAADQFGSSTRGGRIELKHARVSFAGVGVATAYNCGGNCNVPPAQLSSVLLDHVSVSRSQRGVSLGGVGQ